MVAGQHSWIGLDIAGQLEGSLSVRQFGRRWQFVYAIQLNIETRGQ